MCSVAVVLSRGTLHAGQKAIIYQSLYFSYPRSKEESHQNYFFLVCSLDLMPRGRKLFLSNLSEMTFQA